MYIIKFNSSKNCKSLLSRSPAVKVIKSFWKSVWHLRLDNAKIVIFGSDPNIQGRQLVLLPQSELWARGLVQTVILGLHHNPDYLLLLGEQMMSAPIHKCIAAMTPHCLRFIFKKECSFFNILLCIMQIANSPDFA